ncbi:MAG TPA: ABC transporter permease [Patescibacteria group bacterium]|nr:ABC transporter permease [Patescibacteria group bacterium]
MKATMKGEFRKLFTVRSTYILIILAALLIVLVNFYFEGYRGITGSPASILSPDALKEIINNSAGLIAIFIAIIAILFIGHEYRYNTIMYTLISNTHRARVLLAKVFTVAVFSFITGLILTLFAIGCYFVGLELRGASLPPQNLDELYQFGKLTAYFVGYGLIGLLISTLLRSVIAAIAVFLIAPATIEPLASIPLKENAVYLPFSSLDNILNIGIIKSDVSPATSILVVGAYLLVGFVIAYLLFLRRDAN